MSKPAPVSNPAPKQKLKILIQGPGSTFEFKSNKEGLRHIIIPVTTGIGHWCDVLTNYQPFRSKNVLELCNNPNCPKLQSECTGLHLSSLSIGDRELVINAVIAVLREETINGWEYFLPAWEQRLDKVLAGDIAPVVTAPVVIAPVATAPVATAPVATAPVAATSDPLASAFDRMQEQFELMRQQLKDANARIDELSGSVDVGERFVAYGHGNAWDSLGPYPMIGMQHPMTSMQYPMTGMQYPMTLSGMYMPGPVPQPPITVSGPYTPSPVMQPLMCAFQYSASGCLKGAACPYPHGP